MTDRRAHWDEVYGSRDVHAVSWYQRRPDMSLAMIARSGLARNAPIIDVGGGASTLIDELSNLGYGDLTVLDIAAAALRHSRERLGAAANRVTWIESDVLAFVSPKRYALWHDRAVFHFLVEPAERSRYLESLRASLLPGAQVIVATFAEDGPERCSGLPVARYGPDELHAAFGAGFARLESAGETHLTPGGAAQHFTWLRLRWRG